MTARPTTNRRTIATTDEERRLLRWQADRAARAATPIDPADDPVVARGRHNIAEVGQDAGTGGEER